MDARRQRLIQRRGWDRASAHYDRFWRAQLEPVQHLLLDVAGIAAGEHAVEVACGTGVVTEEIARRVGPQGRVLATDLSPAMVAETERRMITAGLGQVETHQADAEELGAIGPFDVALCPLGLMYAPDPMRAVGEMGRVVRPGGRVVASVWGERRKCGWAGIFGIVDARVSSDVCPRFFALGAPGGLAHVVRTQGLVDVEEHRLDVRLRWADADAALGAAFLGGPVALAYAHFDERTRREAHAAYLDSIAAYRRCDGSYSVPGEFVVVAARLLGDRDRSRHRIEHNHHHHIHHQGEPS